MHPSRSHITYAAVRHHSNHPWFMNTPEMSNMAKCLNRCILTSITLPLETAGSLRKYISKNLQVASLNSLRFTRLDKALASHRQKFVFRLTEYLLLGGKQDINRTSRKIIDDKLFSTIHISLRFGAIKKDSDPQTCTLFFVKRQQCSPIWF